MTNFKIIDDQQDINFPDIGNAVGFEYPDIQHSVLNVPGKSGGFYVSSKYLERRLSWEFLLETNGPTNRRDVLLVSVGELKTLQFDTCDGLSLQTEIEITKVVMPYRLGRSKGMIEAVAPDYRFYDQDQTTLTTAETISAGGVALPTVLPINFSNVTGVPKLELVNNGNADTSPIFIIRGPGTNFTIQNATTGEVLQINTTIVATDYITIDVGNRTVLLNDSQNIFGFKSGTFWDIPPGTSELHFVAQSDSSDATELEVIFRSAYKGI